MTKAGDSPLPTFRVMAEDILAIVEGKIGERPWVGVGGGSRQRESLNIGSREAMQAIELGRNAWRTPRVVLYEDILPFAALSADVDLCRRLGRILDPVASHDRRHGTSMLETLQACIDQSWSAAGAARRLGIHRHTIEYRLQQVHRILGYDTRRSHGRFLLETAMTARRLRR
jgi:purine catabolism regulator